MLVEMSEINFFSRTSGSHGTAVARALDKSQQTLATQKAEAANKAREARVEQLRQQYQSGQYQVDSVELSSAIITDLLNNKL